MVSYKPIIVCTGKTSKKFFNDDVELVDVMPFVAQDHLGQFGVGFFVTNADGTRPGWTWGPIMPRHLIQSWRAMKLLEEMPRINLNSTPCNCWALANEDLDSDKDKYLDEEGAVYGDYEKFREARAKVLAMFPTDDELTAMLAVVDEHELNIDVEEIEEQRKNLSAAGEILKRLCIADNMRRERAKIPNPAVLPKRKGLLRRLFG